MSNVYFLGDPHWGHRNILKYRPEFSSIEEHDGTILENILSTVGKRDTLWLMGDVCFDVEALNYLRKLQTHVGQINWVLGNHDTDTKTRQLLTQLAQHQKLVNRVVALMRHKGFWLSHAPLHPQELRGSSNIHGHVHGATIDDPRYINTSCEAVGFTPISIAEIKERTK